MYEISTTPGSGACAEREGANNHKTVSVRADKRASFQALMQNVGIIVKTLQQVKLPHASRAVSNSVLPGTRASAYAGVMLQMGKIFLGMAFWNVVLFGITIYLGMTHQSRYWFHQWVGVLTGIYTCLTHCVVMMHFMGSGRGIKEAVAAYNLPNDPHTGYTRRLRRNTARSSALATFASISIIVVVWLGGAKDVGRLPGMTHAWVAWAVVAFNLYAFWIEYRLITDNTRMIREINAQIACAANPVAESPGQNAAGNPA